MEMRHHFQISRYNAWSRVESVFKEKIKRENGENYNLAIGLEGRQEKYMKSLKKSHGEKSSSVGI